ncbi:MAG: CcmD family protein [Anaerolineae bacterium]|nr:CcmD family protein [Anaerolineae bacterium]
MGDTIFLAAGYAVFWLVTFVFIYSLVSRQRALKKDLEMLENLVKEEDEA